MENNSRVTGCMENHSRVTGWYGCHCNRHSWDIWLKIYRLPNFNMLFQLVQTKCFKSELFSCLPKVDHVINYRKRPVHLLN